MNYSESCEFSDKTVHLSPKGGQNSKMRNNPPQKSSGVV